MGRPRNHWPWERRQALIRLRLEGRTWRAIGATLGLQPNTCRRHWIEFVGGPAGRTIPEIRQSARGGREA